MSDLKNVFIPIEDLPYETKDLWNPDCDMKAIEQGIITGYPSTFHKKPDLGGDVIAPGAFAETLNNNGENGNGVKFLWQHISSRPIGVPLEVKEDAKGLYAKSQVALKTSDGHDAFVFAEMGALDGFSIGYRVHDYEMDEKNNIRTLKRIGLFEYSLVTFAMNPRAGITDVKTAIQTAKTPRELEKNLRELGLSKKAAIYIISLCKPALKLVPGEGNLKDLLQTLKRVNSEFLITRLIDSVGNRMDLKQKQI